MKKLTLRPDDLQVETFPTTSVRKKDNGTVFGEQCTCPTACTCPGCPTCDESCNGTCDDSCYDTCSDTYNETCRCTRDARIGSCYGYSCVYTCGGWVSWGEPGQACMAC
jgi:hypothetical protein